MTFGAIVLIGTLASLAILSANGHLGDHGYERGNRIGQGVGIAGAIGAAIAYLVQQRRLKRRS